ncbi:MAG: SRPBCC family protein [Phycisphaeraceae bacterium]|nr:SRPBCC family protein [Phycisphaeraceae bacterium]
MYGITVSSHVDAPIERVFEVFTDFPNAASYISAIRRVEMLTPPPVGVGTRFRETRVMMGREATEEMTIAEFEPPRRVTLTAASHGARYTSAFHFAPEGIGTTVTFEFTGQPVSFLAKALSAITMPLMKKTLIKCVAQDMEDARRHVEAMAKSEPFS